MAVSSSSSPSSSSSLPPSGPKTSLLSVEGLVYSYTGHVETDESDDGTALQQQSKQQQQQSVLPPPDEESPLSSSSKSSSLVKEEEENADTSPPRSEDEPKPELPSTQSFLAAVLYSVLTVTSFTIAIPTSIRYTESFGVSDSLSGVLVGLVPLLSAAVQYPMIRVFQSHSMRNILAVFVAVNVVGNTLYALGDVSGSYATVLIGRAVSGVVGGPTFPNTFVAKSTAAPALQKQYRSKYMEYVSVAIGVGYALGPGMGVVLELVCQAAGWNSRVVNENTIVGWWMVLLFLVYGLFASCAFVEPPSQSKKNKKKQKKKPGGTTQPTSGAAADATLATKEGGGHKTQQPEAPSSSPPPPPPLPMKKILLCCILVGIVPINVGAFEVVTIYFGTDTNAWGWSIEASAGYLSVANFIPVVLSFVISIERFIDKDLTGIVASFSGLVLSSVFFFEYPSLSTTAGQVAVYSVGALGLLYSAQLGKGFTFAKASKLPPTMAQRQPVMSAISSFYMLGRAVGAFVAPHLTNGNDLGIVILAMNGGALLWIALFWQDFQD